MKRPRLVALCVALIGASTAGIWLWLDCRLHPRLVNGPLVQMIAPDGFVLAWELYPPRTVNVVIHGKNQPDRTMEASPLRSGLRCELTVSGLLPNQDYTYDIGPGLMRQTVHTSPSSPRPFRLLALGDTGNGGRAQWQIARELPEYAPDLIVHTGDLVYPTGDLDDYPAHFYRPYADLIAHIPFYPCLGNHDVMRVNGSALLDSFILPRNGPTGEQAGQEYWFDYAGVRFVAIDSNNTFEQLRDVTAPWLDRLLAQAASMWKIVFFHEPIYTHGKYEEASKLRDSIGPALDRHHVNLVLCGHNHMYERTHPLRAGRIVPAGQGTVYVTTGAGGAGLYKMRDHPPPYLAFWDDSQHGFTIVDVSDDLLHVRQAVTERRYIDDFYIPREALTATAPVADGRQPRVGR